MNNTTPAVNDEIQWGLEHRKLKSLTVNTPSKINQQAPPPPVNGYVKKKAQRQLPKWPRHEKRQLWNTSKNRNKKQQRKISPKKRQNSDELPRTKMILTNKRKRKNKFTTKKKHQFFKQPIHNATLYLPNKRIVMFNLLQYKDILPWRKIDHLQSLLQEPAKLDMQSAEGYFNYLASKKKEKLKRKRNAPKKIDKSMKELKHKCTHYAYFLYNSLLNKNPKKVNNYQKLITERILAYLNKNDFIKRIPLRTSKNEYDKQLIDIVDQMSIFIHSILYRVYFDYEKNIPVEESSSSTTVTEKSQVSQVETEISTERPDVSDENEGGEEVEETIPTNESSHMSFDEYESEVSSTQTVDEETVAEQDLPTFNFQMDEEEEFFISKIGKEEEEEGKQDEEEDKQVGEREGEEGEEGEESNLDENLQYEEEESHEEHSKEDNLDNVEIDEEIQHIEDIYDSYLDKAEEQKLEEDEESEQEHPALQTPEYPSLVSVGEAEDLKSDIAISKIDITPHGNIICCASLKAWAQWIEHIADSAKDWCNWIKTVIERLRQIISIIHGEVYEDGQKKIIKPEQWQCFLCKLERDICVWRHYNEQIQKSTNVILKCFQNKPVQCCYLCKRDNYDISDIDTEHICKELFEALHTTEFWRKWLNTMIGETKSLTEILKQQCKISIVSYVQSEDNLTDVVKPVVNVPETSVGSIVPVEDSSTQISLYSIEEINSENNKQLKN